MTGGAQEPLARGGVSELENLQNIHEKYASKQRNTSKKTHNKLILHCMTAMKLAVRLRKAIFWFLLVGWCLQQFWLRFSALRPQPMLKKQNATLTASIGKPQYWHAAPTLTSQ